MATVLSHKFNSEKNNNKFYFYYNHCKLMSSRINYESFLASWVLGYIKPYLDLNQCGALTACFDLSKAFNCVDHSLVIQDLYVMNTRSWLLNIIMVYLSERNMMLLSMAMAATNIFWLVAELI